MRRIVRYVHQNLELFLRKVISGDLFDLDWAQFLDRVLLNPTLAHAVGKKRMPAFLSFLGGDGCDFPRSAEQAKFIVAEFVNVGQASTVREFNELTLHQ
jgi:hypothetical protein